MLRLRIISIASIWRMTALWLASVVLIACAKEPAPVTAVPLLEKASLPFKLLSVESYEHGTQISLDLDMLLQADEMRSLTLDEREDTGELSDSRIADKEKMHLFVRKEGDAGSVAAATVEWQGRQGRKLVLPSIKMALPEGYNINLGETWYVMGILGGELDPETKTVRFGGRDRLIPVGSRNTVDVPYTFAWQALTIQDTNHTSIGTTTLKARGTVLRMHFYSDLLKDYRLQRLKLTSNALRGQGSFSPFAVDNNSTQVGQDAPWTADLAESNNPVSWSYNLGDNAINIASGEGHHRDRTLYLWAMPTRDIDEGRTETRVHLYLQDVDNLIEQELETYDKRHHRPLREGATYKISNVLTTSLMISEVYYQYVPKGSNPQKPNEQQVYSIVEIYNPTTSVISLADYALVRTAYNEQNNTFGYFSAGKRHISADVQLDEAAFFPLDAVNNTNPYRLGTSSKFPTHNNYVNYSGTWHKKIYGGSLAYNLRPGHTVLIGAGGYVATGHKPSANIELFNASRNQSGSTRLIEKAYLPMAGMQADSAGKSGYMQFMIAVDNGAVRGNDPNPSSRAGVLQLGNGQGIALVKAERNEGEENYRYRVVDISTPLGNDISNNDTFLNKLRMAGISTDYRSANSYSIVRAPGVLPSIPYKADEWLISESENDGVKSLGSRDYVAGLSPFKPNYTGYSRDNNPHGRPFWRGVQHVFPRFKAWSHLPVSGESYPQPTAADMDERFLKVAISSGSATREDSVDIFKHSYDGNRGSRFWGRAPLPVTLTYNFEQAETLSYILYHSWDSRHSINQYSIIVVYDDDTTREIAMPDMGSPHRTITKITWQGIGDKPIKTVTFNVKSAGGGNVAVSFYEMEFYKQSDKYVDPSALFKDLACTELRDDITYAQIKDFANPFYREIARKLYQNSYHKEFRIADYKAWTHPSYQQQINKNQFPYSLIDNPTGMYFQKDEKVIVLVGDTKGHQIFLKIVDPKHEEGYRGRKTYPLQAGFNKIEMQTQGHAYLLYHVNELDIDRSAHPDIRVHFPEGTGTVNGYYDAYKPSHQGRWAELIRKASAEHFDVLGKYAHLLYRTDAYRSRVSNPQPLVDIYDKIVYEEMSMMGLLMNNKARMFRNRLPYTRWYGGFLYAFLNHTAYSGDHVDHTTIATGAWGLAHETGHMNQTTGFNWGGLIEISNNLHSFYIQHVIFNQPSRAQNPNERGNPSIPEQDNDRFNRAWNALFERPSRPVTAESQAFNSLIPFIQLHLYFGMIKGMTPTEANGHTGFLPRLYENLRQANYNGKSDGFQQLEITYHASRAAGYDLTKFFERWGFYRPVEKLVHYNTYWNKFEITVKQNEIDDVKARIKALRLPAPPEGLALEYITVLNKELYRSYRPIERGVVRKAGQDFTLEGWRNVAAWEIRRPDGKLLYTSTGGTVEQDATYTVNYPTQDLVVETAGKFHNRIHYPTWDDSYILYAIDAKGQKTQVYPSI